uniref:Uncharacterized protein n=1 Tax=Ascaris lumbricoides TaxID=6252 RepID=A0A0M3HNQ9_ASCLU
MSSACDKNVRQRKCLVSSAVADAPRGEKEPAGTKPIMADVSMAETAHPKTTVWYLLAQIAVKWRGRHRLFARTTTTSNTILSLTL